MYLYLYGSRKRADVHDLCHANLGTEEPALLLLGYLAVEFEEELLRAANVPLRMQAIHIFDHS